MSAPTELSNDRAVVDRLFAIAVAAIVGVVILSATHSDRTVIVALIGIAAGAASSLGTRRTRFTQPPTPDPTQPPPYTGAPS